MWVYFERRQKCQLGMLGALTWSGWCTLMHAQLWLCWAGVGDTSRAPDDGGCWWLFLPRITRTFFLFVWLHVCNHTYQYASYGRYKTRLTTMCGTPDGCGCNHNASVLLLCNGVCSLEQGNNSLARPPTVFGRNWWWPFLTVCVFQPHPFQGKCGSFGNGCSSQTLSCLGMTWLSRRKELDGNIEANYNCYEENREVLKLLRGESRSSNTVMMRIEKFWNYLDDVNREVQMDTRNVLLWMWKCASAWFLLYHWSAGGSPMNSPLKPGYISPSFL